jgi:hypothetical protein
MLGIMLGCAAFLYLKGTLIQGLTLVVNAILAGFLAFGFFDMLAGVLGKLAEAIVPWAQMIAFLLIFVLALAVLQTAAIQIAIWQHRKEKTKLALWPDRIGRAICGLLLGYIVVGHLLVGVAMAPLSSQLPYARFEERSPNPAQPNKPMLSPDGFAAGLFGAISKGSFAAIGEAKSFAVLHADFLNRLYLNRQKVSQDVPVRTARPALDAPNRSSVWRAPDDLLDSEGQPVSSRGGQTLMLVRVGIKRNAVENFTLSQLPLVCRPKSSEARSLSGAGTVVYPIGYIGAEGRLERKPLDEIVTLSSRGSDSQTIDMAYYVPTNVTPALLGFKANNLVELYAPASEEETPELVPFVPSSGRRQGRPQGQGGPPQGEGGPRGNRRGNQPGGGEAPPQDDEGQARRPGDIAEGLVGGALEED